MKKFEYERSPEGLDLHDVKMIFDENDPAHEFLDDVIHIMFLLVPLMY
jgi:hypothetical protein